MTPEGFKQTSQVYTLTELLKKLKDHIDTNFKHNTYWIRGELSEWMKHSKSGHYYGEIVEYKTNTSKQTISKIRCNMWSNTASIVLSKFQTCTGSTIKAGIKILACVSIVYHENFGLSFNIQDIDPNFTLGDRVARKKEILSQLEQLEIIENNKKLTPPNDFTKVAVISSESAAGKGDFFAEANILSDNNLCEFKIYYAAMQGNECARSVVDAFRLIYSDLKIKKHKFDAIALIRGGGSQADLDSFNHLNIARAICHIPIPVYIGLGHQRDETVLDSISNHCFDTPSKVISFIREVILMRASIAKKNFNLIHQIAIEKLDTNNEKLHLTFNNTLLNVSNLIKESRKKSRLQLENILKLSYRSKNESKDKLNSIYHSITYYSKSYIQSNHDYISLMKNNALSKVKTIIFNEKNKINSKVKNVISYVNLELNHSSKEIERKYKSILSMSIDPTLKRGFSITQDTNGTYITSLNEAKKLDEIIINYHDGNIITKVI